MRGLAAGIMTLLLLGACSSGDSNDPEPDESSSAPAPTLAERCGDDVPGAKDAFFKTPTEQLYGVEVGTGPRGVVLVHGSGNRGMCNWAAELEWMSAAGLHVLAYDQSCIGESTCNDGAATAADLHGAVEELKRLGASNVVVVGASAGGPMAIQVAADDEANIAGAVALSPAGAADVISSPGWEGRDGRGAASALVVPLLVVAAPDDGDVDVGYLEEMRDDAPTQLTLEVLPAGSGHAQQVLYESTESTAASPFRDTFLDFLTATLG